MSQVPAMFSRKDISITQTDESYSGFFRILTYHLQHALYEGGTTPTLKRELFERGEAAAVLLYDPERQCVVLTEQFRIGALEDPRSPWLLEVVAGMIDTDESPEAVAMREVQEETGGYCHNLIPIYRYWVSPGGTSERIHLYCGLVDSQDFHGIHGLEAEGEDIKLVTLPVQEAFALLDKGDINNGATIIALQWLQLNQTRLDSPGTAELNS